MEYEIGSVADLISGLHTPNRQRVRSRVFTPTKRPPVEAVTPQESPMRRVKAPKIAFTPDVPVTPREVVRNEFDSPKSVPRKTKSKLINNFQFLSQLSDHESDDLKEVNVKPSPEDDEFVREYYEDKNGIVEISNKKKNKSKDSSNGPGSEIEDSKKNKKSKKNKNNGVESVTFDDEKVHTNKKGKEKTNDYVENEIHSKKSKKNKKNMENENLNEQDLETSNGSNLKNKKKLKRKTVDAESQLENIDAIESSGKKKRKTATDHAEDLLLEKTIKKQMKKSKNKEKNVDISTENPIDDAEITTADKNDENSVLDKESDDEGLSDFQKAAKRRIESKLRKETKFEPDEINRTLFIGNIPVSVLKLKYKKIFKNKFAKYGEIESIRVRNIPVVDFKTNPKVALIEKKFHPERTTVTAYIKFKESSSVEKALVENNTLLEGNHIRVDACNTGKPRTDSRKTLFLGNLPFNVEDETVRELFEKCGTIQSVRIIRDKKTQIGKGFGFVNFDKVDGVELALSIPEEELKIGKKIIRIKRYNMKHNKNEPNNEQIQGNKLGRDNKFQRPVKNYSRNKRDEEGNKIRKRKMEGYIKKKSKIENQGEEETEALNDSTKVKIKKDDLQSQQSEDNREIKKNNKVDNNTSFTGVMAKKKKKTKLNKGILKKKKISKILLQK